MKKCLTIFLIFVFVAAEIQIQGNCFIQWAVPRHKRLSVFGSSINQLQPSISKDKSVFPVKDGSEKGRTIQSTTMAVTTTTQTTTTPTTTTSTITATLTPTITTTTTTTTPTIPTTTAISTTGETTALALGTNPEEPLKATPSGRSVKDILTTLAPAFNHNPVYLPPPSNDEYPRDHSSNEESIQKDYDSIDNGRDTESKSSPDDDDLD